MSLIKDNEKDAPCSGVSVACGGDTCDRTTCVRVKLRRPKRCRPHVSEFTPQPRTWGRNDLGGEFLPAVTATVRDRPRRFCERIRAQLVSTAARMAPGRACFCVYPDVSCDVRDALSWDNAFPENKKCFMTLSFQDNRIKHEPNLFDLQALPQPCKKQARFVLYKSRTFTRLFFCDNVVRKI